MHLSRLGEVVHEKWSSIPQRYPFAELDDYVIMPNHVHGIIIINDNPGGAIHESPQRVQTEDYMKQRRRMTLSKILGWVKMNSAKEINLLRGAPGSTVWQRDFHDHIIRNEADLNPIRTYIATNPLRWSLDEENPDNLK